MQRMVVSTSNLVETFIARGETRDMHFSQYRSTEPEVEIWQTSVSVKTRKI